METPEHKTASASANQELKALLEIENTNRRGAWYNCLTNCLPYANFTSGEPEILFNPAGFTYYNLELTNIPEDRTLITNYTIPTLIDTFLISEGVGISIEARTPTKAVDISYGDILGFHLYRTFAEPENHLFKTNKPRASIIGEETEIVINDVPEQVLPTTSIELLDAIILHYGFNDAKIKLIYLPEMEQYELVFSINTNQMTSSKIQALVQKLGWFLPRYYSYLICDLNQYE